MTFAITCGVLMFFSFSIFDLFSGEAGAIASRARLMIHAPIFLVSVLCFFVFANPVNWQIIIVLFAIMSQVAAMHAVTILDTQPYFGISSSAGALNTVAITMFILALFPLGALYGGILSVLLYVIYAVSYFLFAKVNLLVFWSNSANVLVVTTTAILVCVWREKLLREAFLKQVRIDNERQIVEDTLYQLVPQRVVQRLRSGESPISEAHSEVCVIFADIVDFSQISQSIPPQLLVEALNSLFERFSNEARLCGVEHVKSIGDSFMAVDVKSQARSATDRSGLDLALSMINHAKEVSASYGISARLRVGVHAGFAVGGVMEATSPFYDFWGTTVNVASRLESSGEPDRIQVSEAVRARYRSAFDFEKRGQVDLKGHGLFSTYWLLGRNDNSVLRADAPSVAPHIALVR